MKTSAKSTKKSNLIVSCFFDYCVKFKDKRRTDKRLCAVIVLVLNKI